MAALLFSVFLLAIGKSPVEFFDYVWRGGFGTAFSFQNTLQRSSPLILTALAVAIPARIGLIMIGGEGALVLGGFAAAAIAVPMVGVVPPIVAMPVMVAAAVAVGGASGSASPAICSYARGVNETISSLLLTYIGIAIMNFFVEGALRDSSNPNKPSTKPIGDAYMVGNIPGTDVHWGFAGRRGAGHRALHSDDAHDFRLRGARHRRQSSRRAGAGPAGRQAHRQLAR